MQTFLSYEGSKSLILVRHCAQKFDFFTFNALIYLAIYIVKMSKKFSTHFYTILLQDPTVTYAKKQPLIFFLLFALKMAVLSVFLTIATKRSPLNPRLPMKPKELSIYAPREGNVFPRSRPTLKGTCPRPAVTYKKSPKTSAL